LRIFDIRVQRSGSLTYVELHGELDLSSEERFVDVVDTVQSGQLVLDLRDLTFIDSTGLRMIVRTWERSRAEGFALEIVGGRNQVQKIFQMTGLADALPMADEISLNGDFPHGDDRPKRPGADT
jgi:anti-anti-sigma factor